MRRFSFRADKSRRASILVPKQNKVVQRTLDGTQIDFDNADYVWFGVGPSSGMGQLICNLKPELPYNDEVVQSIRVQIRATIMECVKQLIDRLRRLELEEQLQTEVVLDTERPATVLWRPLHPLKDYVHATPNEAYNCIRAFLDDTMPTPDRPEPLPEEQRKDCYCDSVQEPVNQAALLLVRLSRPIQILMGSRTMKQVWWERGCDMGYRDEFSELLFDVARIAEASYRPTRTEAFAANVELRPLGMSRYKMGDEGLNVYALDGLLSCPTWIQKFSNVEAILFVVPLTCYDEWENGTNCLEEALKLLRFLCASLPQSIVVVLNKKEYFAEKIVYSDLACQAPFSDFDGSKSSYKAALKYLIRRFKKVLKSGGGFQYEHRIHLTSWNETNIWEKFLSSSRDVCMLRNLHYSGFLGRPSDEAGTISVVSEEPL